MDEYWGKKKSLPGGYNLQVAEKEAGSSGDWLGFSAQPQNVLYICWCLRLTYKGTNGT